MLYGNGLKVQIETPSTPNTLKFIERDDLNKYVATQLSIYQVTQDPAILQRLEQVSKKMDMLYNIDPENISMKSQEQAMREKNAEMIQAVASFNTQPPANVETLPPQAGQPQTMGAVPQVPPTQSPIGEANAVF